MHSYMQYVLMNEEKMKEKYSYFKKNIRNKKLTQKINFSKINCFIRMYFLFYFILVLHIVPPHVLHYY